MCTRILALVLFLFFKSSVGHMDRETFRTLLPFRECITQRYPGLCLKERALDALNETIMSDKPFVIMNLVEIARNPDYQYEHPQDNLPLEVTARSSKLSDILYSKLEEFFKSRVIKFKMAPAFDEARKKGDKGGKGGMMMLAAGGMAAMMAQMFMGKIAFMAGTALILAKVALMMSAIIGLKKLAGGGGKGTETAHVVYASEGHSHGGGGGWHRSLNDAQNLAYQAHITEAASGY